MYMYVTNSRQTSMANVSGAHTVSCRYTGEGEWNPARGILRRLPGGEI